MRVKVNNEMDCYGITDGKSISVNLKLLWEKSKRSEQRMVREFSKVCIHETLHSVIDGIIDEMYYVGGEWAVRKLNKEPWGKDLIGQYKEDVLNGL